MAKITSDYGPLGEALRSIGIEPNDTTRVVIDIRAGHTPIVHVEYFGTDKLIDVVRALGGIEIERKDS